MIVLESFGSWEDTQTVRGRSLTLTPSRAMELEFMAKWSFRQLRQLT